MHYSDEILVMMRKFYHSLSEKDRRRYAAIEAKKLGYGGISYISGVLGCSRDTVKAGLNQLESLDLDALRLSKIRRSGAGRKRTLDVVEGLEDAFYSVVQEQSFGTECRVEKINISQRRIAELLEKKGFRVSATVIKQLLQRYREKA